MGPVEDGKRTPFLLKPTGKDYLWGGRRLKDEFAKDLNMMPLAETWECSTHPDGFSMIAGGEYAGRSLADVLRAYPEFLGTHPGTNGELPILIKLIDAKEDLSVQVHPNDAYAYTHEGGSLGKSEMWYVVDAAKDAQLIYGLYRDTEKEVLRESIHRGDICKYLQKIKVQKDDLFYIEAGTIHAIGAGMLIAEIQQNSNLTYRLYDYDRVDQNGKKRELHIDKALDVANLKGSAEPRQPMRVLNYKKGCARELLARCKYFEVHRMLVNTEKSDVVVTYQTDPVSFRVLLCIQGCGVILSQDRTPILFHKGDCIFFPADSAEVSIHGGAQFLEVRG